MFINKNIYIIYLNLINYLKTNSNEILELLGNKLSINNKN